VTDRRPGPGPGPIRNLAANSLSRTRPALAAVCWSCHGYGLGPRLLPAPGPDGVDRRSETREMPTPVVSSDRSTPQESSNLVYIHIPNRSASHQSESFVLLKFDFCPCALHLELGYRAKRAGYTPVRLTLIINSFNFGHPAPRSTVCCAPACGAYEAARFRRSTPQKNKAE
jgi:hypothetical protein